MSPPVKPQEIASICVFVGGERLGDGLYKLHFLHALKSAFPKAKITWYAGKGKTVYANKLAPLVKDLLHQVVEAPLAQQPFREPFDLLIDTQRKFRRTRLIRRIPHKVFISGCANFLLSDIRPWGVPIIYRKPPRQVLEQMLCLITLALAGQAKPYRCGLYQIAIPDAARQVAQALLPDGNFLGIAPGAGGREKCWPLERFIQTGQELLGQGLRPVFFLGPDDGDYEAALRTALPQALFPLQAASDEQRALEPVLTLALAQRCKVLLANDSGQGHLFAASGVPLVSLFGPSPADKFSPVSAKLTMVRAQDFGSEAMTAIPVDAVVKAVKSAAA